MSNSLSPLENFLKLYANNIKHLSIKDKGWIFDALSGRSFKVNDRIFILLKILQHQPNTRTLKLAIQKEFKITEIELERDLIEFSQLLKNIDND